MSDVSPGLGPRHPACLFLCSRGRQRLAVWALLQEEHLHKKAFESRLQSRRSPAADRQSVGRRRVRGGLQGGRGGAYLQRSSCVESRAFFLFLLLPWWCGLLLWWLLVLEALCCPWWPLLWLERDVRAWGRETEMSPRSTPYRHRLIQWIFIDHTAGRLGRVRRGSAHTFPLLFPAEGAALAWPGARLLFTAADFSLWAEPRTDGCCLAVLHGVPRRQDDDDVVIFIFVFVVWKVVVALVQLLGLEQRNVVSWRHKGQRSEVGGRRSAGSSSPRPLVDVLLSGRSLCGGPPQFFRIHSRYSSTSCVTRMILPRML
ncbi:hypothetical protein EYF80_058321 [Liparis tanakae]|uniref:Uncharacterized protein n=1 Tax=Liparis tanakae TaxID=230148 RepID=A0A4Z2ERI8_9TELE|nr:hypothetical protein EYF80_058321 [Liparis tanakae]